MFVCFDKWEYCEEKIFVGENISDWAKGGVMRGKAYLFVCYLGRVWIDCWKLKHEAGSDMPRAWRCLCRPGGRNRLAHLTCHSRHAAHLPFSGRSTLCHLTLPGMLPTLSEGRSPGALEDFRWCSAWLREGKKINGCKLGLAWLGWKRSLGSTWVWQVLFD